LVILRVAHNCNCEYEWRHHEHLGALAGLPEQVIADARKGADAEILNPRQSLLLRAADELHAEHTISDELWSALRGELSDRDLIELCLLVGHYEMLAMTINSVGIVPDPIRKGAPSRVLRVLQSLTGR
jgi:alkylhydroperoxidase family enzyme